LAFHILFSNFNLIFYYFHISLKDSVITLQPFFTSNYVMGEAEQIERW